MIPLARPAISDEDVEAVARVLRTGQLVQGATVKQFEASCEPFVGGQPVVAVSSGTAALHLALMALGCQPGHRVAVPAYTWPATANVVMVVGAEPVFVDIEPDTFAMSAAALHEATAARPVDVVMPVHPFGLMGDVLAIGEVAVTMGAKMIEDAACALGADAVGRPAGTWGDIGCFSFHPRKSVTTGEGGAVTARDAELLRRVRVLRNHGIDPDAELVDFIAPGLNYRMTEFQAALGSVQMSKFEELIADRARLAGQYSRLLAGSDVVAPYVPSNFTHVFQSYIVLLPTGVDRTIIVRRLRERGVETTIGTYHVPMTTYFRELQGAKPGDFPVTDDVAGRALSLPIFSGMTESEQSHVVESLLATMSSG